jgi:phage terminase Nu1 subunit (DNA packaging protein)
VVAVSSSGPRMNLDQPCTQAEFAELVGIAQPTVSRLYGDRLRPGESAAQWLRAYLEGLREVAAERCSELAKQRAELTRVQRERQELRLREDRRAFAQTQVLEHVLATVGEAMASTLETLPDRLRARIPRLGPDGEAAVQAAVDAAARLARSASLSMADEDADDDQGDAPDAVSDPDAESDEDDAVVPP